MKEFFNLARVDLRNLAHNFRQVRKIVGPGVEIMAVVKADAYGHGLPEAAVVLEQAGADALGVMDLHEALLLKDAGLGRPIFLLAGIKAAQADEIIKNNLIPFIYDQALARNLNRAARGLDRRVEVHLKVDTGMNRLGVQSGQAEDFLEAVRDLEYLKVTGLATHLAEVDGGDDGFAAVQLDRFDAILKIAQALGYNLTWNNAAASAAIMSLPRSYYHMVRPGLVLYGVPPLSQLAGQADLRPVLSLVSQVVQVKRVEKNEPVGYGRTWVAPEPTVLATIPVGYAHGYDRGHSPGGYVLIRGRRAPIRGVVCMNLIMVDVTDIPDAEVGDEVVLLGAQGDETITAESLAAQTDTIPYEILCRLGGLNHREYLD